MSVFDYIPKRLRDVSGIFHDHFLSHKGYLTLDNLQSHPPLRQPLLLSLGESSPKEGDFSYNSTSLPFQSTFSGFFLFLSLEETKGERNPRRIKSKQKRKQETKAKPSKTKHQNKKKIFTNFSEAKVNCKKK